MPAAATTTDPGGCSVSPALLLEDLSPTHRAVVAFVFGRLGARSRYQRFLAVKDRLSNGELDLLTDVDHWHREAVVAWAPVPRTPVAVGHYSRGEEFDLAELAIMVVDDWQRRGVGRVVLRALSEGALRAGIHRFAFSTLRENRGALALARQLGPVQPVKAEGGVVEMIVSAETLSPWVAECA